MLIGTFRDAAYFRPDLFNIRGSQHQIPVVMTVHIEGDQMRFRPTILAGLLDAAGIIELAQVTIPPVWRPNPLGFVDD